MKDFLEIFSELNLFDISFLILMIYFVFQCSMKGFSLSFLSFMKWVLALVVTIIFVPKLQPWVSDYIESDFINSFGIGIAILAISLLYNYTFRY